MSKLKYLELLKSAVTWALDDNRSAWLRAVNQVKNDPNYSVERLLEAKRDLIMQLDNHLEEWFSPIYEQVDKSLLFDLYASPEETWQEMIYQNMGIFDLKYGDPIAIFITTIPSGKAGVGPLYLSVNIDGWGIKK